MNAKLLTRNIRFRKGWAAYQASAYESWKNAVFFITSQACALQRWSEYQP